MVEGQAYNSTSVRGIIRRGEFILVELLEAKGICFLPGGTVECGEELAQALSRELAEEIAGASFSIGSYRGKIGHRWTESGRVNSCLNHYYEVHWSSASDLAAKEPGRYLRWISIAEALSAGLQPPSLGTLLLSTVERGWDEVDEG